MHPNSNRHHYSFIGFSDNIYTFLIFSHFDDYFRLVEIFIKTLNDITTKINYEHFALCVTKVIICTESFFIYLWLIFNLLTHL